jgi:beta-phosphoglucomutase-like phosphatase (HAD superfamily)
VSAPLTGPAATTLLCDADGTLFPSEEPAYEASADVMNKFLATIGAGRSYRPAELQAMTNGKNFRGATQELAAHYGRDLDPAELDDWVAQEKEVVTAHLRTVLRPDPDVTGPLERLAGRFQLAVVTSSALSRLDACLHATGLAQLFPATRRFSAEDSLPRPTSKPDPAVYAHAGRVLQIRYDDGIAIEDSVNGARSAVAAGYRTAGITAFVPDGDRAERTRALRDAGVSTVLSSWTDLADLLLGDDR